VKLKRPRATLTLSQVQKLDGVQSADDRQDVWQYGETLDRKLRAELRRDSVDVVRAVAEIPDSLAGTVLIDSQQQRLAKLSGQLVDRVQFGYGVFGHIDNGGTIEIGRVQVGPLQWKTALLNIQLSGRLILFKTISKQQYETRSNFRAVAGDLSLSEANDLLVSPIVFAPSSEIRHSEPATTSLDLPR